MRISSDTLHKIITEEISLALSHRRKVPGHLSLVDMLSENNILPDEIELKQIISDSVARALETSIGMTTPEISSPLVDIFLSHLKVAVTTGDVVAVGQAIALAREEAINQIGIDKIQGVLSLSDAARVVASLEDVKNSLEAFLNIQPEPIFSVDKERTAIAEIGDPGATSLEDIAGAVEAVGDIETLKKSSASVENRIDTLRAGINALMAKMKDLAQTVEAEEIMTGVEAAEAALAAE